MVPVSDSCLYSLSRVFSRFSSSWARGLSPVVGAQLRVCVGGSTPPRMLLLPADASPTLRPPSEEEPRANYHPPALTGHSADGVDGPTWSHPEKSLGRIHGYKAITWYGELQNFVKARQGCDNHITEVMSTANIPHSSQHPKTDPDLPNMFKNLLF